MTQPVPTTDEYIQDFPTRPSPRFLADPLSLPSLKPNESIIATFSQAIRSSFSFAQRNTNVSAVQLCYWIAYAGSIIPAFSQAICSSFSFAQRNANILAIQLSFCIASTKPIIPIFSQSICSSFLFAQCNVNIFAVPLSFPISYARSIDQTKFIPNKCPVLQPHTNNWALNNYRHCKN